MSVVELRRYVAVPGRMDALMARFRDHTLRIFADQASDPFAMDVRCLPELEADITIVGGRVVHGDDRSDRAIARSGHHEVTAWTSSIS